MRLQIVDALRRLGKRAGYDVTTLNNDIPIKFTKDFKSEYGFQISDGVREFDLKTLFESDVENRIYLVTGLDEFYLKKSLRELKDKYPEAEEKIKFISVKHLRTNVESGLSEVIFGTKKYASVPAPNTRYVGSMPDLSLKAGLVLKKLGSDNGYQARSPEEGRYVWYGSDNVTKVLEVIVGTGFRFQNIRMLNKSTAKKRMYLSTKLYGKIYREATDKLVQAFPDTSIEFMSIAEMESMEELKEMLQKRILGDLEVKEKIAKKKTKDPFGW